MERDTLLSCRNVYDHAGTGAVFLSAMKEAVSWHYERNAFYRDLLNKHSVLPESIKTEEDLIKLPPVHANFFKTYETLSVPIEDIVVHVTSSGTTGQKSQMFFDQSSWDFGQSMILRTMEYYGFVSDTPTNYLLYTYEPTEGSKLGTAKTDEGMLQYAPINECRFALKYNGQGHDFDVFGTIEAFKEYETQGLPVRIFGFPSFLYFTLNQMKSLGMKPLRLNKESMTMLGGGWKGYADKQISKQALYSLAEEMLGIPESRCRDGYGSTEHSVPYFECANHNFHIPIYSRMYIRDFKTLEPLDFGKEGFACFVTPHLLSVPALSVLMGDKAVLHKGEECGCGIETPYMQILGRAGTSAAKSCAIAASELLKR